SLMLQMGSWNVGVLGQEGSERVLHMGVWSHEKAQCRSCKPHWESCAQQQTAANSVSATKAVLLPSRD
uniref:Uncharacterized protein n=1 Tax=Melopsittacus undulatus TaxID=13146 RepID=A0A8V5H4X7_MELUD